jgi:thiol-disulfide isomerase/thioredoxin
MGQAAAGARQDADDQEAEARDASPDRPARSGSPAPGGQAPGAAAALSAQRHMLYFWATWCVPCKSALPELLAWSKRTSIPVLAVSDEDAPTINKFLASWTGPFPELVASDELRRSHVAYGVSGTPTFVLVDEKGKIEWRQVGYSPKDHLSIPGWSWSPPAN